MDSKFKKISNRLELAGIWNPSETASKVITGHLVKRVVTRSTYGEGALYLVKVDKETECVQKDKSVITAPVGAVLGVNESADLEKLSDYASGTFDVSIEFVGLKDVGKGNPMKQFDVGVASRDGGTLPF